MFLLSWLFLCFIIIVPTVSAINLPQDTILIEAEDGQMDKGITVVEQKDASGKAIDSAVQAMAIHEINIPKAGKWYVWIRLFCPDGNADSYWIGIEGAKPNPNDANGGPEAVKIYSEAGDSVNTDAQPFNIWYWDSGVKSEPPSNRFFEVNAPGNHKLWSKGREALTLLDQILLTMDDKFDAEKETKGKPIVILKAVHPEEKLTITWGEIKRKGN